MAYRAIGAAIGYSTMQARSLVQQGVEAWFDRAGISIPVG
jgi:hypothetical protein